MSHSAFGEDRFGQLAEKTARFFGTPHYIIGQSVIVGAWIVLNSVAWFHHWDSSPFIMLNLIFSTQAAYAAPLILLAQTRQADRDKLHGEMIEKKHTTLEEATDAQTKKIVGLLQSNLTEQVATLTREIHALLTQRQAAD